MKIMTAYGHIVNIFGIYWTLSANNRSIETILLGLPSGNGGLSTYRLQGEIKDQLKIIDRSIPSNFIYCSDGIYHKALIERNLLDRLCEYDEEAYKQFLEIIKTEGIVESDFY